MLKIILQIVNELKTSSLFSDSGERSKASSPEITLAIKVQTVCVRCAARITAT